VGRRYLIDSNVISGYLTDSFSEKATLFLDEIIDATPNISAITQIEALCWKVSNPEKENTVQSFISDSNIFPLTDTIVLECVRLRRAYKIKTPDAIIPATALVHDLVLISCNSDFQNIQKAKNNYS
jgi:predicted nucleic acid-binding protein